LSIKSALEIAKYTFLHGIKATTNVKHAFLWILIASLPVLGFTKLRQVSYAMSVHHPLHFLPLYQSFAIIANAMCGIVYYNDFGANRVDASHVSLLKYMVGLGLVCLAVAILTHRYNSAKHFIQVPLTRSLTHSLTHLLNYLLTHSLTYLLTRCYSGHGCRGSRFITKMVV
jgi:hypothetical protein